MKDQVTLSIKIAYDGKRITPQYELSHELPAEQLAFLADFVRDHVSKQVRVMRPLGRKKKWA